MNKRAQDIAHYTPLVRRIAGAICRHLPPNVQVDDMVQAGLIGLNDALSRFEENRPSDFETYAARRIRGEMLDALRLDDRLPKETRRVVSQIRTQVYRMQHELGRAPRAAEVAHAMGWPLARFHHYLVEAGSEPRREGDLIEDVAEAVNGFSVGALDGRQADPALALQWRQRRAELSAAFDALEEVERYVIDSITEGKTLAEIGATLGVTGGRVSQISSAVVAKLRERMRGV